VDYVFAPTVEDIYPQNFQTTVAVERLTKPLEGAVRPGHFEGVTTVVAKMFCLTQPERAYFGQKDAQQCVVIRQMVTDLGMLMDVVVCPTVREADGLAMSSRNVYLSPEERQRATALYRALTSAAQAVEQGERDGESLRGRMRAMLEAVPGLAVEYVSVADPRTLGEMDTLSGEVLMSLAVKLGRTRLIDNMPFTVPEAPARTQTAVG
jgi:pantoate--beta-alanine ligase